MSIVAVRRSAVSVIVAVVLLWILASRQLIDTRALIDAAAAAPGTLAMLALLLFLPTIVGSVRYQAVLQAMARRVPMSAILPANVVSTAVSVWLPASAGFMELMRFGLVARSIRNGRDVVSKTDLAVAGLVDRLLGLAATAIVGLAGGLYMLSASGTARGAGLGVIVALTLLVAAGCACPFLALRVPRIERMAAALLPGAAGAIVQQMIAAVRRLELRGAAFAVALAASVAIALMAVAAMYLAMRLFAPATPLLAVAIGIPTLAVAALLPGNVGGFGGNQAAAALVFAALELDPGAAVLASLLVSIVGLLVTSIGGAIWAPRAWNPSGAGVL